MSKSIFVFVLAASSIGLGGCVPKDKYDSTLQDAQSAHAALTAALEKQIADMTAEQSRLGKRLNERLVNDGRASPRVFEVITVIVDRQQWIHHRDHRADAGRAKP